MSGITTHILDLTHGRPADGVQIKLYFSEQASAKRVLLNTVVTNADGRLNDPLLSSERLIIGTYELVFYIGDYFRTKEVQLPEPPFLDQIPVRFGIADAAARYHVPLLVSPWGYQIYRGS